MLYFRQQPLSIFHLRVPGSFYWSLLININRMVCRRLFQIWRIISPCSRLRLMAHDMGDFASYIDKIELFLHIWFIYMNNSVRKIITIYVQYVHFLHMLNCYLKKNTFSIEIYLLYHYDIYRMVPNISNMVTYICWIMNEVRRVSVDTQPSIIGLHQPNDRGRGSINHYKIRV